MHSQSHESALAVGEDAQKGSQQVFLRAGRHLEAGVGRVHKLAAADEPDAARPLTDQRPSITQEDERSGRF
jgi:hypothetical protein